MKYVKGEKVYMLKKSIGDSIDRIKRRTYTLHNTPTTEKIIYKNKEYLAYVGYYNYQRGNRGAHIISYVYPVISGDFYATGDFINEVELNSKWMKTFIDQDFEI